VNLAASPVGRILRFSSASFLIKSQPARASSLFVPMAVLETSGLTLHRFCEDDVDLLSGLMANQDFMRFSLGVYTREQTLGVLGKVLARQNQTCRRSLRRCSEAMKCCSAIAVLKKSE
jgi:hypothetical protein